MNNEEALRIANKAIFAYENRHLKDLEIDIISGSLDNKTYQQIANNHYSESHIKNVGKELWTLLSKALGEKVSKTNFKSALERRSHSEASQKPQEPEQNKAAYNNTAFLGREGAIATSEYIGIPQLPRLRLEQLTERVRAWELEEDWSDQELYALEGKSSDDPHFIGREEALNDLDNLINNEDAKVVLIQAEGGVGKTALAWKWFERQDLQYLELRVGMTPQNLNSVEDWVRHKLRDHFKEQNPERNFLTMLEQLKSRLQIERIGVLIDNLEPALINGQFIEPHGSYYVELLRVLAHPSVQSITLITSREPLYEPGVMSFQTIQTYSLEGLAKEVWEQYFENRNISIDVDGLSEMHRIYGGNALAMDILSRDIRKESQGNLKAYWQHNRDNLISSNQILEILIKRQFEKLSNDNFQAYKLLCRLGFYPTQDVSFIPKAWLFCLLWDVQQNQRRRVIDALLDRSLVKIRKVPEDEYYLHPVIRFEAISRLRKSEESPASILPLLSREIAYILKDTKYQKFLISLNNKSILLKNEDKVPYKASALRALYFDFELDLADNRIRAKVSNLFKCTYALDNSFYFGCEPYLALDHSLYFLLVLARALVPEITTYLDPNYAYKVAPELLISLRKLKEEIPEPYTDKFKKWRKEQGKAWLEKLQSALFNHRYIGLSWKFTPDEKALLKQYYEANILLLDCINNPIIFLDRQTKDLIEEALFMPISELALPTESIK